ncbi:MAG: hypothetical protein JWN74_391 [Acidobacteriaceae bacterium]|nr:hypothetical protein [Acidobacteriaceae bacterium]
MSEFNNRIAAQRQVLQIVNRKGWEKEELFGLSHKAIERWTSVNRIEPQSHLVMLVEAASSKLFFLANKSQEQVSDEYQITAREIALLAKEIELEIA